MIRNIERSTENKGTLGLKDGIKGILKESEKDEDSMKRLTIRDQM